MSADNWANCPQCKINTENKQATAYKKIESKYGKVSLEEWSIIRSEIETEIAELKKIAGHPNLGEYWDIGIKEGDVFEIDYRASCIICGFSFNYRHLEEVKIK